MAISLNSVFAVFALALGYLLGSIPFGLLLTRLAGTADLRTIGSGNIGATNVLRTGRKDLAAATLVLDALKATLGYLLAAALFHDEAAALAGAAGAFLRPPLSRLARLSRRQGRRDLPRRPDRRLLAGGAGFALVWLGVAASTRYSSAAALAASVAAPLVALALRHGEVALVFGALAALLWIKHAPNIARLATARNRASAPRAENGRQIRERPAERRAALRLAAAHPLGQCRPAHVSRADQQSRRRARGAGGAAGTRAARRGQAHDPDRRPPRRSRRELLAARRLGVRFVALGEPEYPPALRQIDSAPPILALRGREEASAAAGHRHRRLAQRLRRRPRLRRPARARARAGGLCRGLRARARHRSARACGGVGDRHDRRARRRPCPPYPPEAVPLIPRIAEHGAVVSEMPIEWEPRGRDFPRRNRIVSGLVARRRRRRGRARLGLADHGEIRARAEPRSVRRAGLAARSARGGRQRSAARRRAYLRARRRRARACSIRCARKTRSRIFARIRASTSSEPLWGEQPLLGVDPEGAPRAQPREEFDEDAAPAFDLGEDAAIGASSACSAPRRSRSTNSREWPNSTSRRVRMAVMVLDLAGRIEHSGGDRVALLPARRTRSASASALVGAFGALQFAVRRLSASARAIASR